MTAMFQLDYVPNRMFNLFLKQIRGALSRAHQSPA